MTLMKQKYLLSINICPEIIAAFPNLTALHNCSGAVPQVVGKNEGSNVRWWP